MMSSNGRGTPPLFGDDADSDKDDDLFSSAVEKQSNNNDKPSTKTDTESTNSSNNSNKQEVGDAKPPANKTTGSAELKVESADKDKESEGSEGATLSNTKPDEEDPLNSTNEKSDLFASESKPEKSDKPALNQKPVMKTSGDFAAGSGAGTKSSAPYSTTTEELPGARAKVTTSSSDQARHESGRGAVGGHLHSDRLESYDLDEDDSTTIEILVSDPKKIGDGMNSYIVYKITTRTNSKMFHSCEFSVTRRFSDFLGLHEKLHDAYLPKGKIVPLPPEKSVMGTTKVKMTKEETAAQDFVEKRRAALERFLNRIAKHPDLRNDTNFIEFLQHDGELPKATSTSALSGAGIARLFSKVGESLNKMTFTMSEPDQWFEDKVEELENFDKSLKDIYASIELLVNNRKELAVSTGHISRSLANLGSHEEDLSLSKALSSLAEVELKVEQLHTDQTDSDFFVFCELIKDYVNLVQSIREVLHERVKVYKLWQESESALVRKKEQKAKLDQQRKSDRQVELDIAEIEERVVKFKENFETISASVRKEFVRYERQRARDFKTTLLNYLQCMMNNQQQLATMWESFLPEAKLINSQ